MKNAVFVSPELGSLLKHRRIQGKHSQRTLAATAQLSHSYISKIERGGVRISKPALSMVLAVLKVEGLIHRIILALEEDSRFRVVEDVGLSAEDGTTYDLDGRITLPVGTTVENDLVTTPAGLEFQVRFPAMTIPPDNRFEGGILPCKSVIDREGVLRLPEIMEEDFPGKDSADISESEVLNLWRKSAHNNGAAFQLIRNILNRVED